MKDHTTAVANKQRRSEGALSRLQWLLKALLLIYAILHTAGKIAEILSSWGLI